MTIPQLQYVLLMVLPLPLFYVAVIKRHFVYFLPPFLSLLGIYVYNIIGSHHVLNDPVLYSEKYFYTLLSIIFLYYPFYAVIFLLGKKVKIDWRETLDENENINLLFVACLWAISFYFVNLYIQRHGLPPIFSLTSSLEYVDIYALRAEKATSLTEGSHWYNMGFYTVPSFIFIYTYVLYSLHQTRKYKYLFYSSIPLIILMFFSFLGKGGIIYLLCYFITIKLLVKYHEVKSSHVKYYIVIGMASIILILRLYLLDRSFYDVLALLPHYMFERICLTYTDGYAIMLNIFPLKHDYFYGVAFGNPGHVFPFEPVDLSQFLGMFLHGGLENYSVPAYAQGYANFGVAGIYMIVLLMFMQMLIVQVFFKSLRRNPIFLSVYIYIVVRMIDYAKEPIQGIIAEEYILFALFVCAVYYLIRDVYKKFCSAFGSKAYVTQKSPRLDNLKV